MNIAQRKHAARRIEEIINKNLPRLVETVNVSHLHKGDVAKGIAKPISNKDMIKLIKAYTDEIDPESPYSHGQSIPVLSMFKVNPSHERRRKAIEEQNKQIQKRRKAAKDFILAQQDAIILGSSEEALEALRKAEQYKA